jgi:hypothetical protein
MMKKIGRNNPMMEVEIRVQGQIDEQWSAWFEDMKIIHLDPDETLLTGTVRDQASLYGLIAKLRDLGLLLRFLESKNQQVEVD